MKDFSNTNQEPRIIYNGKEYDNGEQHGEIIMNTRGQWGYRVNSFIDDLMNSIDEDNDPYFYYDLEDANDKEKAFGEGIANANASDDFFNGLFKFGFVRVRVSSKSCVFQYLKNTKSQTELVNFLLDNADDLKGAQLVIGSSDEYENHSFSSVEAALRYLCEV